MAHIRKRNGRYQARIKKQRQPEVARTFDTKAEALAWSRSIEGAIPRGENYSFLAESERLTLYAALERYLKEVSIFKKSHRQEKARIARWQKSELAAKPLGLIRGPDIAGYRDWRAAQKAGANTIRLELALLSHLFEVARKEWGLDHIINPVKLVRRLRLPRGRDRRLRSAEETATLLTACEIHGGPILLALVKVAIETAMRRSELASLRWDNVNLVARTAHLIETKNGDSRTVPLSSIAITTLQGLPGDHKSGLVFGVTPDWITKRFIHCRHKSGIQGLAFHDLRHEATSRLFEKGLSMMEVSSVTGHKSLQMLKRYTHLKASELALKLG